MLISSRSCVGQGPRFLHLRVVFDIKKRFIHFLYCPVKNGYFVAVHLFPVRFSDFYSDIARSLYSAMMIRIGNDILRDISN
jgi:hypothetical protein